MALAVVSAFETVNLYSAQHEYEISFISETGEPFKTASGLIIHSEAFSKVPFDTLIIGGASQIKPASVGMLQFLSNSKVQSRRIAAVCTGAFILAEAGLLNGLRATTHWLHARELQKKFPKVKVDEDKIFINDGNIWTSAGMSAGIDLALALIEDDLGQATARSVAKKLVVYHRRPGGQSQFSSLLELEPKSDRIRLALSYAKDNIQMPLSVEKLANAANLSPRQFSRAFTSETGQTPAKAIENLRIEMAKDLIYQSRHPLDVIANLTGFNDPDRMRRAFLRAYGQPPQVFRRNYRDNYSQR